VTSQIDGNTNAFYLGDGNDTIIFNPGTGNNLYLGDGRNTVNVEVASTENTIVGGDGRDIVTLQNGRAAVYGMDDDDDIHLVLNGTSTLLTDWQSPTGLVVDGGHSNFRAGITLNGLGVNTVAGEAGGRGDSIILDGAGTLNFGTLNGANQLSSIERIDAATSTATQTIQLNYNDILGMTDDKNALIINIANNDRLELTGMTGFTRVLDNVAINDAANGGTAVMKNYDVFTDGTVTLLISATGAAATSGVTMDGTGVAI